MNTGGDLLLEDDRSFLNRKGWDFEVTQVQTADGHELQIVVHNYPLPAHYTPRTVDLLVRQLPGYPDTAMDMFWTRPQVLLASGGRPDRTESVETYLGLSWQRWSRHAHAWRPMADNLETFFATIHTELGRGR